VITTAGPVVTADEVCQAVATILETFLPDVLASIPDDRTIDPPSSYSQVPTREAVLQAEAELPAVGIFSAGLSGPPVRDEDGNWSKTWRVTVVGYVRAGSYTDTQWMCRTLAPLILAVLAQNQTLGGIAASVTPIDETYDVVDSDASRTLAGCAVDIDVEVQDSFNDLVIPPYDPDGPLVITTSTDAEVLHPALA
jgi:hypothetical protein